MKRFGWGREVPIAEPLVHLGPDDLAATMAEDVRAGFERAAEGAAAEVLL
jgi:hypothetical protein